MGRDFAIILACFRDLGYTVEWRVINAAEYGYQQRRRRTFIFAYKDNTVYASRVAGEVKYNSLYDEESRRKSMGELLLSKGFFAKSFHTRLKMGMHIFFSERPAAIIGEYDKPSRTMLTSEGSFNRTTHIVRDKKTGEIRFLTPIEVERIQGFPSDWTKECIVNGEIVEMPVNKRRFMMGNALAVNLVNQMEKQISDIFDAER